MHHIIIGNGPTPCDRKIGVGPSLLGMLSDMDENFQLEIEKLQATWAGKYGQVVIELAATTQLLEERTNQLRAALEQLAGEVATDDTDA